MLVLSRKANERITIGHGDQAIVVEVISTHGGRVRLGITAPETVSVHRREVWDRRRMNSGGCDGEATSE